MKTKTVANHHNCANKAYSRYKGIIMPFETVGIVGRDCLGRDKVICMACKRGEK